MVDLDLIDFDEIRKAFDFLVTKRMARTKSGEGFHLRKDEAEVAKWLEKRADENAYELLDRRLKSYGFSLVRKDGGEVTGLPAGSVCYFVVCIDDIKCPWIDLQSLMDKVGRSGETPTVTRRWVFFLWYNLLGVLYTRLNRTPEMINEYTKTWFSLEEYIGYIEEGLKRCRKTALDERSDDLKLLFESTGKRQIRDRVKRWVGFLESIGYLSKERKVKNEYCQTIVFAQEVALQARTSFSHIVNDALIENGFTPDQMQNIIKSTYL